MRYPGSTTKLVILVLFWISISCTNERKANGQDDRGIETELPRDSSEHKDHGVKTELPPDSSESTISKPEKNINWAKDSVEILTLIRQMLIWSDAGHFDLHPYALRNDTVIGFNFDLLNRNLKTLRRTGFFTEEFIDNYVRILSEIDMRIRNKEIEPWLYNDGYPPFAFASDASPWCLCQDNLDWNDVVIMITSLDQERGDVHWTWGNRGQYHPSWSEFSYSFKVSRKDQKWKITYLQGFDYDMSTR